MTVQELINKLSEIPEGLRQIPVEVETETEGGSVESIRVKTGNGKIWWEADHVVISAQY